MEIRHIEPADDRMAVSRVYEESWKHAYKGIIPQEYLDRIPSGRWASTVDKPGFHSMVMLEGGAIIGTTGFCPSRFEEMDGWGEIVSLYLLPDYIGKGFGRALMTAALDELRSMGFGKVFLWVLEENSRARRFYERCGFTKSAVFLEDNIGGRDLREIQYCIELN